MARVYSFRLEDHVSPYLLDNFLTFTLEVNKGLLFLLGLPM